MCVCECVCSDELVSSVCSDEFVSNVCSDEFASNVKVLNVGLLFRNQVEFAVTAIYNSTSAKRTKLPFFVHTNRFVLPAKLAKDLPHGCDHLANKVLCWGEKVVKAMFCVKLRKGA